MAFFITTSGTQNPVVFDDLGGRSFPHPTAAYDLETEYSKAEISASADVQAALSNGWITAANENGVVITSTGAVNLTLIPYSEFPSVMGGSPIVTLQYVPYPDSETIVLDGAIQEKGDAYSIAGNAVTFTFDLTAGQRVLAKYWA